MTLKSPFSVRIQKHGKALGDAMNEIRSWLDSHKIQPTDFRFNTRSRVPRFSISNSIARRRHACPNGLSAAPHRNLPGGSKRTMQQTSLSSLSVDDLLITSDLKKRSRQRPHDRATISALQVLSRDISGRPSEALPRLVEMAKELCGGGSAGISAYEPQPGGPGIFRWTALTGPAAQFTGETTPRDFSPCGICLDRSEIILMDRPGRYYEWLNFPASR